MIMYASVMYHNVMGQVASAAVAEVTPITLATWLILTGLSIFAVSHLLINTHWWQPMRTWWAY